MLYRVVEVQYRLIYDKTLMFIMPLYLRGASNFVIQDAEVSAIGESH